MTDIILAMVILTVVGGSALYVFKAKKRGESCIGCPHAKQCNSTSCSCSCAKDSD